MTISLCLVMIVKDESKVIKRCLDSVIDYIDSYCICDTGSTDDTIKIIKSFFKKKEIKGKILQHEWKNFGHNRTLAVEEAKGMADYLLLMDADFIFKCSNTNFKQKNFTEGSYLIKYEGNLDYRQPLMVKGDLDWKYIGVTHEYIHCPMATRAYCADFTFLHVGDGFNKSDKFTRDIALLEQGLLDEPNNMRYYFYLAQSHKDLASMLKAQADSLKKTLEQDIKDKSDKKITMKLKELQRFNQDYQKHFQLALDAFNQRIKKEDFKEEVYYAKYMIGHCHYHMGSPPGVFLGYFLEAYSYRPQRLEALFQVIRYYRVEKKYQIAYDLGARAAKQPYPHKDCLFIDSGIHKYLFKHEIAMCSYYLGDMNESLQIVNEILQLGKDVVLPQHRTVIEKHQQMCLNNINKDRELTSSGKPRVAFFTYNELHTGGAELSFGNWMKYLDKTGEYEVRHIRDYREIYHFKPNLIVCQQFAIQKGVEIAEELGIPVAVTQHGPNQWHYAKRSNYFLFNSEYVANTEVAKTGVPNYDILWPYIPFQDYHIIPLKDRILAGGYLTFIGRPTQAKGITTFLEIAKALPQQKFLVVGGKIPEQYQDLIDNLNNLEIMEFTQEIEQVYAKTRLLIFPSYYESFGRVAVEASLYGIPVIASDLPGIREATGNLTNYVEEFKVTENWVNRINFVLSNEKNQIDIAKKISDRYQEISQEQIEKFAINVNHLVNRRQPCKYTHQLRFTITISVYNRPDKVIRAIKSILDQTYQDWEIIVVDDASTDDTWNKLKTFKENLELEKTEDCSDLINRIKLIQMNSNQGTYCARNRAIQEARGDYIINLDSDDQLVPEALDLLKGHIWATASKAVQFKFFRDVDKVFTEPGYKNFYHSDQDKMYWQTIVNCSEYLNDKNCSWGHFCIERDYLIKNVGYYDSVRIGADTEMMCRLRNFHRTTNLEKILYYAEYDSDQDLGLTTQTNSQWAQEYIQKFMAWHQQDKGRTRIKFPMNERPFELPQVDELKSR